MLYTKRGSSSKNTEQYSEVSMNEAEMEKIASLMLVTICAFSLTACGKEKGTAAYRQITDDMKQTNCAEGYLRVQ